MLKTIIVNDCLLCQEVNCYKSKLPLALGKNFIYHKNMRHYKPVFLALSFLILVSMLIAPHLPPPSMENLKITFGYDPTKTKGEFLGKIVYSEPVANENLDSQVLGDVSNKRIEVNLAAQHVYAYEGANRVFDFVISSGKWAPTPRGTFSIARKVRAQAMTGGNRAIGTYYYLPNVPYVMFFGNSQIPWSQGFSFHGTYWHNNFGQPMSHGCVNMKIPEAGLLYSWAPIGTPVVIY